MLCQIIFVGKERPDAPQLQDALAAVHDRKLIAAHQFFSNFAVIGSVAGTVAPGVGSVEGVDGFLAQRLRQFLQGGRFRSAKEDLAVAVADDGIGIVLVYGFEL